MYLLFHFFLQIFPFPDLNAMDSTHSPLRRTDFHDGAGVFFFRYRLYRIPSALNEKEEGFE